MKKLLIGIILTILFSFSSVLAINYNSGEIDKYSNYKSSIEKFMTKLESKTSNYSLNKKISTYKSINLKIATLFSKVESGKYSNGKKETYRIILGYLEKSINSKISDMESNNIDLDSVFLEIYDENAENRGYKTFSKEKLGLIKEATYIMGNYDAEITFIEYSDLECPFCKKLHTTGIISDLIGTFDGKVNFIFKHFPLSFHAQAAMEAEALECAGELGGGDKYYTFLDEIFKNSKTNGRSYTKETISELAGTIGLDSKKILSCIDSGKFTKKINENLSEGKSIGVTGTPGNVLINNKSGEYILIPGAYPYSHFEEQIKLLLIK